MVIDKAHHCDNMADARKKLRTIEHERIINEDDDCIVGRGKAHKTYKDDWLNTAET